MKFTCETAALASALRKLEGSVSSRSTLPILSNILLQSDLREGTLTLTGTTLDVYVQVHIEADFESEERAVTLPFARFSALVNAAPAAVISVEVDRRNRASVVSGDYETSLFGLPADEFPRMPQVLNDSCWLVPQIAIPSAFKKLLTCVATDSDRVVLAGVFFDFAGRELTLVATDGRRLAAQVVPLEQQDKRASFILPTSAAKLLALHCGDEGEVKIEAGGALVRFSFAGSTIVSKVVDGTYPNYRNVIPARSKHCLSVDRATFASVVSRVSLFCTERSTALRFALTPDKMTLSAVSSEVGEAKQPCPCKWAGDSFIIGLDPTMLQQILKTCAVADIEIDLIDPLSPIVVRAGADFLYVQMPLRLAH